jgi:hypothetical protein
MAGRRAWIVFSDERGSPETGYELKELTDVDFECEQEYVSGPFTQGGSLHTLFTLTLRCLPPPARRLVGIYTGF